MSLRASLSSSAALLFLLAASACSGSDVFEDGSGSGGGATGTGATSGSSPTGSSAVGPGSTGSDSSAETTGAGGDGGAGQGGAGVTVGPTTGTGGAGQGGAGQGGAGQGGAGQGGAGQGGAPSCDRDGVEVIDEVANLTSDAGLLLYNGETATDDTILIVELWFQYGADGEPHTFEFTGENYADCHTCAVIAGDCVDVDCQKRFLVQSGTLEVDEVEIDGGRFRGTLRDVVAVEVTFSGSVSTPVPGGETWCVDEVDFDVESVGDIPFTFTK